MDNILCEFIAPRNAPPDRTLNRSAPAYHAVQVPLRSTVSCYLFLPNPFHVGFLASHLHYHTAIIFTKPPPL
ncbi:hypothetical protein PCASD_13895 [Puccinia coronata f. sp. avenae]|uniref:Uncharacterized protein n=1 Tax=Puccinia coronata f. sp. avenae TaxID=200324 RepID=A0A2N5U4Z6_9BASI|nr:hypothetical protein PCASD_13895 [Puccinia coronata f. sp. avenae]